ncbi:MAG TPA: GNAT family N-acetyltransferase [Sphingomicrobium sp.]
MAEIAAETDRLRLRDWTDADAHHFYAVMNTPSVMQHLGGVQTVEEWLAGYDRIRSYARDFGHTLWIVEDKEGGELQGFCGLKRVNSPGAGDLAGQFEIGWRLRESAWGRGIAKEAAIASMDLAFGKFAAPHVVALTIESNKPSQGLMERLGMTRRPEFDFWDERFGPEVNPSLIWRLDAADWPAARQRALLPR